MIDEEMRRKADPEAAKPNEVGAAETVIRRSCGLAAEEPERLIPERGPRLQERLYTCALKRTPVATECAMRGAENACAARPVACALS